MRDLLDAAIDLVAPIDCVGCGEPRRHLCASCVGELSARPRAASPDPTPPGFPPTTTLGDYDGALRAAILAHKEDGRFGLRDVLGRALARAVEAGARDVPIVLVPVPSSRRSVRARGYDATTALARAAAQELRRSGSPAVVVRALRHARRVQDQAGLSTVQRAANLSGAFVVRRGRLEARTEQQEGVDVVVVDDVATSGATLVEAARALSAVGVEARAAVLAATRRRQPFGPADPPVGPLVTRPGRD